MQVEPPRRPHVVNLIPVPASPSPSPSPPSPPDLAAVAAGFKLSTAPAAEQVQGCHLLGPWFVNNQTQYVQGHEASVQIDYGASAPPCMTRGCGVSLPPVHVGSQCLREARREILRPSALD